MLRSMIACVGLTAATAGQAHTIPWSSATKNAVYVFAGRGQVDAAGVRCLDEYYPEGCAKTGLINLDSVPLPSFNVGQEIEVKMWGSQSAGFETEITEISSNKKIHLPWTSDSFIDDGVIISQDFYFNGWIYNGVSLDRQTFGGTASFEFFPGNFGLWGDGSYALFRSRWRLESYTIDGRLYAVPEPSIWAMMIVGFGTAGTALRRQRRRQSDLSVRRRKRDILLSGKNDLQHT